ncbi:MAG TPA: ABC transporter permease [Acidimicrobiales bacterium]|nr:ABC transporter permease [Acidimicrobiales bacterium]
MAEVVLDKPSWRELAHIYRMMASARIRADWQYRASFFGYTITQGLITFLDFLQIAVIFGRVDQLAGWSVAEVAFLYGTSSVAFFLGDVFISQVERGPQRVRAGTFDALLIRPLGTMFQLCADDFAFRRVGKLVQAIVVLAIAVTMLDVAWTTARVAVLGTMLVAGTVIFSSIWVIVSSLAFWMVDGQEVANGFIYGASLTTQYPLQVMSHWVRWLFMFVVPAAFVNFFPALYVLGKPDPFGFPSWVRFVSPAVAAVLFVLARSAWLTAVRHYRSTGS